MYMSGESSFIFVKITIVCMHQSHAIFMMYVLVFQEQHLKTVTLQQSEKSIRNWLGKLHIFVQKYSDAWQKYLLMFCIIYNNRTYYIVHTHMYCIIRNEWNVFPYYKSFYFESLSPKFGKSQLLVEATTKLKLQSLITDRHILERLSTS